MIRFMQTVDFPQLKIIGMACFEANIDPLHHYPLVKIMMCLYLRKQRFKARQKANVLIKGYVVDDQVVGFYELEQNGLLASLYVLPAYQHQKIGKALLMDACREARNQKQTSLRLEASTNAQGFYARYGFKAYKKPKEVLKIPMIPMVKQL